MLYFEYIFYHRPVIVQADPGVLLEADVNYVSSKVITHLWEFVIEFLFSFTPQCIKTCNTSNAI